MLPLNHWMKKMNKSRNSSMNGCMGDDENRNWSLHERVWNTYTPVWSIKQNCFFPPKRLDEETTLNTSFTQQQNSRCTPTAQPNFHNVFFTIFSIPNIFKEQCIHIFLDAPYGHHSKQPGLLRCSSFVAITKFWIISFDLEETQLSLAKQKNYSEASCWTERKLRLLPSKLGN